jgi:MraZ protein
VAEEGGDQGVVLEEPPRGIYPARVDDKGRLKLPEKFQKYLAGLDEKKLFVTSKDRVMATVYPIRLWRQNEKFFGNYKDNPPVARRVWFTTQELGSEAEMDAQGRVQMSPELRRDLQMENQPVKVLFEKGAIQVMTDATFQTKRGESKESAANDLDALTQVGFI